MIKLRLFPDNDCRGGCIIANLHEPDGPDLVAVETEALGILSGFGIDANPRFSEFRSDLGGGHIRITNIMLWKAMQNSSVGRRRHGDRAF